MAETLCVSGVYILDIQGSSKPAVCPARQGLPPVITIFTQSRALLHCLSCCHSGGAAVTEAQVAGPGTVALLAALMCPVTCAVALCRIQDQSATIICIVDGAGCRLLLPAYRVCLWTHIHIPPPVSLLFGYIPLLQCFGSFCTNGSQVVFGVWPLVAWMARHACTSLTPRRVWPVVTIDGQLLPPRVALARACHKKCVACASASWRWAVAVSSWAQEVPGAGTGCETC